MAHYICSYMYGCNAAISCRNSVLKRTGGIVVAHIADRAAPFIHIHRTSGTPTFREPERLQAEQAALTPDLNSMSIPKMQTPEPSHPIYHCKDAVNFRTWCALADLLPAPFQPIPPRIHFDKAPRCPCPYARIRPEK